MSLTYTSFREPVDPQPDFRNPPLYVEYRFTREEAVNIARASRRCSIENPHTPVEIPAASQPTWFGEEATVFVDPDVNSDADDLHFDDVEDMRTVLAVDASGVTLVARREGNDGEAYARIERVGSLIRVFEITDAEIEADPAASSKPTGRARPR